MANENDNSNGGAIGSNTNGAQNNNRRGSFTTQTFSALFGRSNSINQGTPATPAPTPALATQPSSISSTSARPVRRMSITTVGLNAAGTSPIASSSSYFPNSAGRDRRASVSTGSTDSQAIDESAIEDDDAVGAYAQSVPTTPFARRMSIGANAIFSGRGGPSPGTAPSSSHSSVPASVSGGSTLFPIPARQRADHESAPSPLLAKQRTTSFSKPSVGPSGLSQGLAGARRTSVSSLASTSTTTLQTFVPGSVPGSLGRSTSGRRLRNPSDLTGSMQGEGYNWSETFRARAESTATRPAHHRSSFGANSLSNTSPNTETRPMAIPGAQQGGAMPQRAASISHMSEPPKEMPKTKMEVKQEKKSWLKGGQKPDEVGERILRGEFLMD